MRRRLWQYRSGVYPGCRAVVEMIRLFFVILDPHHEALEQRIPFRRNSQNIIEINETV
jgi:hypothetical protein